MARAWYAGDFKKFIRDSEEQAGRSIVFASLNDRADSFIVGPEQKDVWKEEIKLLRLVLRENPGWNGRVYFEYEFPRIGRRADVVLLISGCVLCLEFKGGEGGLAVKTYTSLDKDQVLDYALDFADFTSESHHCPIIPFLVVTHAEDRDDPVEQLQGGVHKVICTNAKGLSSALKKALLNVRYGERIKEEDYDKWENASYEPTPTIVQAAERLFENNKVEDITRSGADVGKTIAEVEKIIQWAKTNHKKVVCFVTGKPGAGKTLVGLKLATSSTTQQPCNGGNDEELIHRVFLSGNYPLVHVLQQALVRDFYGRLNDVLRALNADNGNHTLSDEQRALLDACKLKEIAKTTGSCTKHRFVLQDGVAQRFTKKGLTSTFESKIQLVSRFREEYKSKDCNPPKERVFVFDEAQRAWDSDQVARKDKKKCPFQVSRKMSEPEALLRYLSLPRGADDWCVAVALVGNGQDIHNGEAGIKQWYSTLALRDSETQALIFADWEICYSSKAPIAEIERAVFDAMVKNHRERVNCAPDVDYDKLHLQTSMRSYHAPEMSEFVNSLLKGRECLADTKQLLDGLRKINPETGRESFFLRVTDDVEKAKRWLVANGYGSLRRYGLLCSSKAVRLRRYGFHTINKGFDEVAWFLDPKNTINSSYAMEIAATEFKVQGLEIDLSTVGWDGDCYYDAAKGKFVYRHFSSSRNQWREVQDYSADDVDNNTGEDAGDEGPSTKDDKRRHLENAYRVLLTRARQGMIIFVPKGEDSPESNLWKGNYESTYNYLIQEVGIEELKN